MSMQLTALGLQRFADNAISAGVADVNDGWLFGARCVLFTNQPVVNVNTVYADLTQPTFTGYAIAAITWSGPFVRGDKAAYTLSALQKFEPTAAPTGDETVYGYGLITPTAETPVKLLALEMFPTPVLVLDDATVIAFVLSLLLPIAQQYGGAEQIQF